ncbi:ATP synthase subunit c [Candidatus Hepatincolaceae symbiont of Richtersius coronifer]
MDNIESYKYLATGLKYLGVGLCMLPLAAVASSIGKIFSTLVTETSRNPAAKTSLFTYSLIGFALVEAAGLYALVVAFIMLFSN